MKQVRVAEMGSESISAVLTFQLYISTHVYLDRSILFCVIALYPSISVATSITFLAPNFTLQLSII